MGVTETLRILLAIFLSTVCIQNVRLFGVYDVRWPFLAEIHTAPLKRFVPSSVLQAVRALRNAPAASAVFLAGVAPVAQTVAMQRHSPLQTTQLHTVISVYFFNKSHISVELKHTKISLFIYFLTLK